jgi:hypothetical protein
MTSMRIRQPSTSEADEFSLREVEAILRVFAPAWPHIATPIPGGDSGRGELSCLDQHGIRIAETGPSGDDGGAYLYLLAGGTVAELRQWPIEGSDGWMGLLGAMSLRRALGRYPELRAARLVKRLSEELERWFAASAQKRATRRTLAPPLRLPTTKSHRRGVLGLARGPDTFRCSAVRK